MKRTVTAVFEFEDGAEPGRPDCSHPSKAVRKAMEIASCAFGVEGFSLANLDGELLVDKNGNAPDEVKILPEYVLCMYFKR